MMPPTIITKTNSHEVGAKQQAAQVAVLFDERWRWQTG
jgi:hypothetical protein